ncbi:MAG TPA: HAD-IC family P-type ATPase [Symbiobacteriaceae bacterium]|jgi:Ca2+-transporting ATPase
MAGTVLEVHSLPGRLRVPWPGLRGNRALAARLTKRLAQIPGIRSVQANPDSGRVLILYDPRRVTPACLLLLRAAAAIARQEVAAAVEADLAAPGSDGSQAGLTTGEARRRLAHYGPNALQAPPRPSFWQRFWDQLKDVMVLTLLGGAGLSLLVGRVRDALTITVLIIVNAAIGASQAGKADGATAALRKMAAPRANVMRDGRQVALPSEEVVPGDMLLLEAGDKVPADGRIVAAWNLEADESLLTGESVPVSKETAGQVFAGTTLTRGRCLAEVTATGMQTEMGRIAQLLGQGQEGPTPLQERMAELGRVLVKGSLLLTGGVVLVGLLRGQPLIEMFMTGISLAVAAIPEGLPTFVTLGLASGVGLMARRKALVRHLQAVETLGCATVICSDKTGTLTTNQMTVREVYAGGRWYELSGTGYHPHGEITEQGRPVRAMSHPDLKRLLEVGVLCNNAVLERNGDRWSIKGDTTEGALLVAGAKAGLDIDKHRGGHRRTREVPFESARRRMSVICEGPDGPCIYTKGAPEAVVGACTLASRERSTILEAAERMAGRGYRVLAAAYRPAAGDCHPDPEADLVFLGLFGMMDPPRPEVPPALVRCRRAGIRVLMLTGDHPRTAAAVAREIGLLEPDDLIFTGDQLARMTDAQLRRVAGRLRVCARVSPEQKLRVVRALRARGHVVAMTGDGVNDAPAVREADIGIAMGLAGTEVTKEAAGLVLADDNFATIVAAVEQGRATHNNIRKSVRYLLASNIGEMVVMAAAVILGLPMPLLPLQILWLNLVGDGLPALALGAEPIDGTEMQSGPRRRTDSIFAGGLGGKIVKHGLGLGAAGLGLFMWALYAGKPLAVVRTLMLTTLVMGQLLYMARCRRSATGRGAAPGRNPLATWAVAGSAALLVGSVWFAPLRHMLQLTLLSAGEWLAAGTAAAAGNMATGWGERTNPGMRAGESAHPNACCTHTARGNSFVRDASYGVG